jgi:outer membrane lipoprotein-sorting protein
MTNCKRFLPFLLFFAGYVAYAQTDPAANAVLDRFSDRATNAPSVSLKFKLVIDDLAERTSDSFDSSVIISKDSYKLEMPNNIIWFDGTTSWSYLIAEDEVVITTPNKSDNSFQNNPASLFTMHKNGYKTRLIEETASNWVIDLYPEYLKSDLIRVRLTIGKSQNDLKIIEYRRKDGIVIYINVNEYNLNVRPEQNFFVFDRTKYRGVEVVDMR